MKTNKNNQQEPKTNNENVRNVVNAALCLALCMVLPFLTGQIPQIGSALSPMHIPALLCGFICGWPYALVVGFAAPLLRFMLFGMPPLFPTGTAMAFELAAYGAAAQDHSLHLYLPDRGHAGRTCCLGNRNGCHSRSQPGSVFLPGISCRCIPQRSARHHLPHYIDTRYYHRLTESAFYRS